MQKKGDKYICKTLMPSGMRDASSTSHKLNDPWEINIDNIITIVEI